MEAIYRVDSILKETMSRRNKSKAPVQTQLLQVEFKPKTLNQAEYLRSIIDNDVTFATGPAGSGKSFLSIGLASQFLLEGRYDRIIIARPTVEASPKGLGFLKGSLDEKLSPYLYPAVEHLKGFLGRDTYLNKIRDNDIQFEALEFCRGRTYDYSMMILTEAQNCTTEQIKMFVTRIGTNSKVIVEGDTEQSDIIKPRSDYKTDLEYVISKVKESKIEKFGVCQLYESDIVRNPIIGPFLRIFK